MKLPTFADCYLLSYMDGGLLIDIGTWAKTPTAIRVLTEASHRPTDALLTHGHPPQAEGGIAWQRQGVRIGGHPAAAESAESLWNALVGGRTLVDFTVDDGDILRLGGYEVEVFYTPGHTLGCCSYLVIVDDVRWLFVGDLFRAGGVLAPRDDLEFSAERLSDSLERVSEIEYDALATAHGWTTDATEGRAWMEKALGR